LGEGSGLSRRDRVQVWRGGGKRSAKKRKREPWRKGEGGGGEMARTPSGRMTISDDRKKDVQKLWGTKKGRGKALLREC